MQGFRRIMIETLLAVLAMHSVVLAQQQGTNGPVLCPGLDGTLTPTLLDVLIYPGFTLR